MNLTRRTSYREKTYTCGEYLDVYIYPVYPAIRAARLDGSRRRRKRRPTREVQKKLNQRHAREKLTRILHANFTERDLALTLTYRGKPDSEETAMQDLKKFIRKIRYRFKKIGKELKYVWQMERSKTGRIHFHMVLSGDIDRDELEKLWGKGYANSKRLQFGESGLDRLSRYISKSHAGEKNDRITYRSYNGSKNLIDPEPEISDSKIGSRKKAAALADMDWNLWQELYPEYEVENLEPFCSEEYGSIYIFARLHRKDCTPVRQKKRRGNRTCQKP